MATPVTIKVQSDDPVPVKVAGVIIRVYQINTIVMVTSGMTDANGEAAFLLPDASYDVRFYKLGLSILPKQPQRIVVDQALGNVFTVTGHVPAVLESSNPHLCRVSGILFGPDGKPRKGVRLSFLPKVDIAVLPIGALLPQEVITHSAPEAGMFDFHLVRGISYEGSIYGVERLLGQPGVLDIRVPNQPGVDLATLLFPLPVSAVFSPVAKTLSLAAGPNSDVAATVTYSDGSVRTSAPFWTQLSYKFVDGKIVEAAGLGKVTLTPLKTGVDVLTLERTIHKDTYWAAAPAFVSGSLTVTVNP